MEMMTQPKIEGYRQLSDRDAEAMNAVKAMATACGDMINGLSHNDEHDRRWLAIAQTNLQQGFMAAVRAIARPTTF